MRKDGNAYLTMKTNSSERAYWQQHLAECVLCMKMQTINAIQHLFFPTNSATTAIIHGLVMVYNVLKSLYVIIGLEHKQRTFLITYLCIEHAHCAFDQLLA